MSLHISYQFSLITLKQSILLKARIPGRLQQVEPVGPFLLFDCFEKIAGHA